MLERIQKFISGAGVASRRKAEKMIQEGRIRINGQIILEPGYKIDPAKDNIVVDGLKIKPVSKMEYIVLYKPAGFVTTMHDPQGRPTVKDIIMDIPIRLYPVGRLDFNTLGLLLMTNDGEMANHLLHPRYEVEKVYEVIVKGLIKPLQIQSLRNGVIMKGDPRATAPAKVILKKNKDKIAKFHITIHEGRNRQIRRMCTAVGLKIAELTRIRYGCLTIKELEPGQYRRLTPIEIKRLKKDLGLIS